MFEVHLLGVRTVPRLGWDAWSMNKFPRQATNEYAPPPRLQSSVRPQHLFDEVTKLGAALHPGRARSDNGKRQSRNPLLFGQRREIGSFEAVPKCLHFRKRERAANNCNAACRSFHSPNSWQLTKFETTFNAIYRFPQTAMATLHYGNLNTQNSAVTSRFSSKFTFASCV